MKTAWFKKLGKITCASLIMTTALGMAVQAEGVKLCEEDELFAISADGENTGRTEYFDCDGNYAGFLNTNYGGYGLGRMKKGVLTSVFEDGMVSIYKQDMPLKKIAEYQETDYVISVGDSGYLVGSYPEQKAWLYSDEGSCIYEMDTFIEENSYWGLNYVKLVCTPSGYYVAYLDPHEEETDEEVLYHVVSVSKDGSEIAEITESFADTEWGGFETPEILALDDDLFLNNNVYSMSGELLMEDVGCAYEASGPYNWRAAASAFLKKGISEAGEEVCVAYDADLNPVQEFAVTEELETALADAAGNPWNKDLKYDGQVLMRTTSEELNGEICTGFVAYCGPAYEMVDYMDGNVEGYIPYARTEAGAYIYLNGETLFLPMDVEDELRAVNDYLYLTMNYSEELYHQVRGIKDGEILMTEKGYSYSLTKDYVTGYFDEESQYYGKNVVTIDSETGELNAYNAPGAYMPWYNNCLVARRSIYKGITDQYGNWIVKIINGGTD